MPRVCTVCSHPKRDEIADRIGAGDPLSGIARTYGLSGDAMGRHSKKCIPAELLKAKAKEQDAGTVLARVHLLQTRAEKLLTAAETKVQAPGSTSRDVSAAAAALRELRSTVELLGRLTGELQPQTSVQVAVQVNQPREYTPAELDHMAALALDIVKRRSEAQIIEARSLEAVPALEPREPLPSTVNR